MRTRSLLLCLVVLSASIVGCSTHGLAFKADRRIRWATPASGATVTLPVRLSWSANGYDGRYAVFLDSARPIRPRRDVASLVSRQDACHVAGDCLSDDWLSKRGIYITSQTELTIEKLRDGSGKRSAKDPHEATIVLLDSAGRRTSDTAFVREFVIDRSRS
jgi:hypothetical protein